MTRSQFIEKILMCFSVLRGSHSDVALEATAEVCAVAEIKLLGDFFDAERGCFEYELCATHLSRDAVFCGRHAAVFLEKPFEIIDADVAHLRDLLHRLFLAQILFKIFDPIINAAEILLGSTVLTENAEKFRNYGKSHGF